MSVTIGQVLSWRPCLEYTRKRLEELFAGRETINVNDVLEMDIPDSDKLWAVLREEFIPAKTLHEFACRVAEQALLKERAAGREPDERSWKAIEIKRRWMQGAATKEELLTALAAAEGALRAAAEGALRAAVEAAEGAAAVELAVRAAVEGAAWALRAQGAAAEGAVRTAVETAAVEAAVKASTWAAVKASTWVAVDAATRAAVRAKHIEMLKELLQEGEGE